MNAERLDCLILEPPVPASASVIWLHGLGADGYDFEPLVPELGLRERGARFVLPHAPHRPVTINGGYVMRAWYDIRRPDLRQSVDAAGIAASVTALNALIDAELAQGIPADRIVLAGFSQGGVIVLQAGLNHAQRLGGILALSTYLAVPDALTDPAPPGRATPIFLGHGREDTVVPFAEAEASCRQLQQLGCSVEFHAYRMPHSVCLEELADIRAWLDGWWSAADG